MQKQMMIVDKRQEGENVEFGTLRIGCGFSIKGVTYLKINDSGVELNAMKILNYPTLHTLYPDTLVKPVKITVTIED